MSTYREIHGKAVKSLGTDPSAETDAGQIWYNTSSDTFKTIVNLEAWSSASSAITQMHAGQGFGSQTDAVGAGGYDPASSPAYVNPTDEYNGSGWAAGANIGTARYSGSGCGSQTAGLIAGGNDGTGGANLDVEEYNGTSWAEQTNISTGHGYGWMAGIQTAAIVYTGLSNPSPATITVNCEEYNGSSWTEVGNVNTGKYGILGFGATQDTAVKVGGGGSPNTEVEEWNGSSWTAVNSIPANRSDGMGSGAQTAGLIVAGNPGGMTSTLTYDGTNWTTSPATLSETRAANARGATITGNATSIIHHAGPGAAKMKLTEEYNSSTTAVTAGAWAAGGNMNTARSQIAGMGIVTAALAAGGYQYGPNAYTAVAEEYDGSTWTNIPSMPVTLGFRSGAGTTTAGLAIAGHDNTSPNSTSEWDGSSWSAGGTVNAGGIGSSGNGTQTAAWLAGSGETPSRPNTATEEYNGSAWTSVPGALNTGRGYCGASGPQTDGTFMGGATPSPAYNNTEEYNGTAWTNSNTLAVPMSMMANSGGSAPSNSIMAAGSANISTSATTQQTDGSTWYTSAALSTARGTQRACGAGANADSSLCAGGNSPSINSTEEFTGETTAVNVKTLTQS